MKYEEKLRAIKMRKAGKSMYEISVALGVSKSSVSLWVRDIVLNNRAKKQLTMNGFSKSVIEKRRVTRLRNEEEKRLKVVNEAAKDFSNLDKRDLKIIGCMLYFAEGGKTQRGMVRVSNSNPDMVRIMMRFFKEICMVPQDKFRGHIHTHSLKQVQKAERFWSQVTTISRQQFFKTYTKGSIASKGYKNNLPYGTFDIYVCDTQLFLKIKGWIQGICKALAI